ncbi:hypothetical protein, partial [Paenibacillus sp. 22594]|uniref:hypothetical protein n=1 Tax=Paenibacillus sp. 22594 TaxID=3453947 RepID=UPI003F83A1F6
NKIFSIFGSHLREIPLTRCSVFKDQILISARRCLSAATFIIYHSTLDLVNLFFDFFFSVVFRMV